jgi:transposase-like protein
MPRQIGYAMRRYELSEVRRDTRPGHYERKLGEVKLRIPKLRT